MTATFDRLWAVFSAGGWVMWPLLALSLISITLIVERLFFWLATHGSSRGPWLTRLGTALRAGDFAKVRALCSTAAGEKPKGGGGVYADFTSSLLDHIPETTTADEDSDAAAQQAVEDVRPRIERFSITLSTIVTLAPMLGILGTVVGIIDSFRLLGGGISRAIEPAEVSRGIAVALYTTAFGLIVAIVTFFPYMVFRAQADRCLSRLETLAASASQGLRRRKSN